MTTFENRHPLVLLLYFSSVLLITMFVSNPVIQAISLIGGIVLSSALKKNDSAVIRDIVFFVFIFLITTLTNPLFSHNGATQLFFFNDAPVTAEAFFYGASLGATVIAVILWFKCVNTVMTSDKTLYLFGKAAPKLSLILSMSLRYVPMLKRRVQKVSRAQKAMGYRSEGKLPSIKNAMRVFISVIGWSLESSIDTSASMTARGYGSKGRTNFNLFRFIKSDLALTVVSLILVSVTVYGAATGKTDFYFYPKTRFADGSSLTCVFYASFAALTMIPVMTSIKKY